VGYSQRKRVFLMEDRGTPEGFLFRRRYDEVNKINRLGI
jgi:hypothetical protein